MAIKATSARIKQVAADAAASYLKVRRIIMEIYYVAPKVNKSSIITLENILLGRLQTEEPGIPNQTHVVKRSPEYALGRSDTYRFDLSKFINDLKMFNSATEIFRSADRWNDLYKHFKLPKKSGGLRPIDAPKPEFSAALTLLRTVIENNIGNYFHHPCAFAYVRERCTVDLVEVHQKAESRWFAHFDFSNFFGSTTLDFVVRMCERIYPLNIVMADPEGKAEFIKAIELCFLNGGLPQGTPMSPFLTNVMMIPIDHELLKFAGNAEPHLIYTRYADDIFVSCKYDFNYRQVEKKISEVLHNFGAPFTIKPEKTHYGSNAGRNWILGVMLNKDNKITIGHEVKKKLKAMLTNYVVSTKSGNYWDLDDVYSFLGKIAYYRSIEKDYVNHIIASYNQKYGVDIEGMMKAQTKGELAA